MRIARDSSYDGSTRGSDLVHPLLGTPQTQPPAPKTLYTAFLWFSILSASTVACMNSFAVTINNVYGKNFSVEEPHEYFSYYSGWGILLLICPLSAFIANIASGSIFTEDAVKASINVFNAAIGRSSNVREVTKTIQEPPMSQPVAISALIAGLFTSFTYAALSIDAFQYLPELSKNEAIKIPLLILYGLLILGSTFVSTSSRISGAKSFLTRAPLGISYLYPDLWLDKKDLKIYSDIRILLQKLRDMKDLIPYLNQTQQKTLMNHLEKHEYDLAIAYFQENKPERSQAWGLFLTWVNRPTLSLLAVLAGPLFYTIGYQLKSLIDHPALSEAIAILSTPLHVLMYLVILPRAIRSIPTFYQYMKHLHSTMYATMIMSCIILVSACSYGGLAYSAHNHAKAGDFNSFFPFLSESILIPAFTVMGGATASIINLFCLMTFCVDRPSRKMVNEAEAIEDHTHNLIITKKEIDTVMKEIENLGLHAVKNTTDYQHNIFSEENMSTLFSAFIVEEPNCYQELLAEQLENIRHSYCSSP